MPQPQPTNLDLADPHLERVLHELCELLRDAGGTTYLVGGSVRDHFLRRKLTELDLEVFGLAPERMREVIGSRYPLDLVGRAFGILKLRGLPIDVGLPRRESKIGLGHRGFTVHSDPLMPLAEAAARRDFTINAVYLDPLTDTIVDPWGGLADLTRRRLRHTSAAFAEDPLRVLRGMQLVARFDLQADRATIELCRHIEPEGLPAERIFAEWQKLILQGEVPALGLAFLRDSGWVRYFPELAALIGVAQDSTFSLGRFEVTQDEADRHLFGVPTLRNARETQPYFHDGSVTDLRRAVRMMAKHQLARTLDDEEVAAIVAWLESLTGEVADVGLVASDHQR